jgi:hypothetical protein
VEPALHHLLKQAVAEHHVEPDRQDPPAVQSEQPVDLPHVHDQTVNAGDPQRRGQVPRLQDGAVYLLDRRGIKLIDTVDLEGGPGTSFCSL